jgi:heme-degrading monooxygenase HmoA
MFIAMNRFKVIKGAEKDFEHVWLSRETHLDEMAGFVEFHLLKGPEKEDHVLYSSHKAHAGAGGNKPLYLGHPEFEGFQVPPRTAGA